MDDGPAVIARVATPHVVSSSPRLGRRIAVHGMVQGVGFRPFVYRLAIELGLEGTVRNTDGHVVVETAGTQEALGQFVRRIAEDAPPLARVGTVALSELSVAPAVGSGFRVATSDDTDRDVGGELPPDIATCADCLRELFDPADRRYRYPFTNCTNCGPRATIIRELPYDRERTVMQSFPLCDPCAAEYADPANRRFHAEPVACATCGPQLAWQSTVLATKDAVGEAALRAAVHAIATGHVVAVKSLGGYQLVCDATNADAVTSLRERKRRPTKPLAVMVADRAALYEVARPSATGAPMVSSEGTCAAFYNAGRGRPVLAAAGTESSR